MRQLVVDRLFKSIEFPFLVNRREANFSLMMLPELGTGGEKHERREGS